MTIDYTSLLSTEQKKAILEQRIAQFASEAYQHEINKRVALESENSEAVTASDSALEILIKAISIHQDELANLPKEK